MSTSLQAFREWAVAQGGNIGNPGVNTYRGECVSLVQQDLSQVFDIPYAPRGNAKDFVPPTAKFKAVGTKVALQPGDIVRYGNIGDPNGHIEIIDDEGKALSQNRGGRRKVERNSVLPGYNQVFRPIVPFSVKTIIRKSNEEIAGEVIAGLWGNGDDRKSRLASAGYDYTAIQNIVNSRVAPQQPARKSNEQIASEVLAGKWGNGQDRKNRLAAAGYNYAAIQAIVNRRV